MKYKLQLPKRYARYLCGRSWLEICEGELAQLEWLCPNKELNVTPLELYPLSSELTERQVAGLIEHLDQTSTKQLVFVSSRLSEARRLTLEAHSASYLDQKGNLHLQAPHLLIHIEASKSSAQKQQRPRGLGPSSVRAIQALIGFKDPFTLTELSALVGLSVSQVHVAIKLLESEGLVNSMGKGPARRRQVIDQGELLQWLTQQSPARRQEEYLDLFVYARRPEELWHLVSQKLQTEQIDHAFTGSAAATLYEAGPTAVPFSLLRVSPSVTLTEVARALDAEVVEQGANLRMLRDTGLVGITQKKLLREVFVAPKARIYLDALSERRGEDIAELFKEVCFDN